MTPRQKQAHSHDKSQLAMFNQTRAVARRTDPETSHAAARMQTPGKIRKEHMLVLEILADYPEGLTDEEMLYIGINRGFTLVKSGFATRRGELCPPRGKGVRDSGKRRVISTGAKAIVWELDLGVYPEVLPPKIRGLRDSQRRVYELFQKHGNMTHAEVNTAYLSSIDGNEQEMMTASGVRTRVAELVQRGLVEQKSATDRAPVLWGIV